jgi:hypothetical protein
MKKLIFAVAALSVLAACQTPAEITSEPSNARMLGSVSQDKIGTGTTKVTVRAYLPSETGEGLGQEVLGAKCDLRSDDVIASAVTPQEVIVPTFKQRKEFAERGVPSALVVTCSSGGRIGKSQVTATAKSASVGTGGGLGFALATLVVSSALASSTPWSYDGAVNVVLAD